jgi:hypothetical protein
VTVVAHSGAGQLLAHLGHALRAGGAPVEGYLFVDAGTPTGGGSRLDQLRGEDPAFAQELGTLLASGELFPNWDDDLLAPLVPDADRRRRLVDGIRPLPSGYWREPIPAVSGWPDAPCGALLLSNGYEATEAEARARGWSVRRLGEKNHFLMLAEPATVAREVVELQQDVVTGR